MGLVRLAIIAAVLLAPVACTPPAVPQPSPSVLPASTEPSPAPAPAPAPEQPVEVSAPGLLTVGPKGAGLAQTPGGAVNARLRAGVLVPVGRIEAGWASITTPCSLTRWMPVADGVGMALPQVILDPGHGGGEGGATGPGGLQEKTVNLDVVLDAAQQLNARGVTASTTRTGDYRATLAFRVAVAQAAKPALLVSVHHNADPDGPLPRPGTETFYQFRSPDSRRLSGLIYEEVVKGLTPLNVAWVGDTDAGAKWRLGRSGTDYYGLLRQAGSKGITAVLAELAFVSNPPEEALLGREDVRLIEARALAEAVVRYRSTEDPGSGFTTPYARDEPAGPGGGTGGCVDPG